MNTSHLELEWRTRAGGRGRAEREYLDFLVDGQSLRDLLRLGDVIGCLGWLPGKANRRYARELLLKEEPELLSGRNVLYICPECGDLGCGAITVRVEKTDGTYTWSDFGLESSGGGVASGGDRYAKVGPFRFTEADYINVFARF